MKPIYFETLKAIKEIDFPRFPIRVLKEKLNLKSNSPVLGRLRDLEELGLIVRQNGSVNITDEGNKILNETEGGCLHLDFTTIMNISGGTNYLLVQ